MEQKKTKVKVKVVASRYAQALLQYNIDVAEDKNKATPSQRSSDKCHSSTANARVNKSKTGLFQTPDRTQQTGLKSSKRTASDRNVDESHTKRSTPGGFIDSNAKQRLKEYQINREIYRKRSRTGPDKPKSISDAKQQLRTTNKITTPKSSQNNCDRTADSVTRETSGASKGVAENVRSEQSAICTNDSISEKKEELEMLSCLYHQICFAEAKADEAFCSQKSVAIKQLLAAWKIVDKKLESIHDGRRRLEQERRQKSVHESLSIQTGPAMKAFHQSKIFRESFQKTCRALESALNRIPATGIKHIDPTKLMQELNTLAHDLESTLHRLDRNDSIRPVSAMLDLDKGMKKEFEIVSQQLFQIIDLLKNLQIEVERKASFEIQRIQKRRIAEIDEWSAGAML